MDNFPPTLHFLSFFAGGGSYSWHKEAVGRTSQKDKRVFRHDPSPAIHLPTLPVGGKRIAPPWEMNPLYSGQFTFTVLHSDLPQFFYSKVSDCFVAMC